MTSDDRLFSSRVLQAVSMPIAFLHGAALRLRPRPEPIRVDATVISIGNLHAGGTGKTPHVLALARHLAKAGRRTAIVSRGYGGTLSRAGARVTASHTAREVGDEPRELFAAMESGSSASVPIVIGADRVEAARTAAELADVLLLDDGYQHRRLARDLDIVILPAAADPRRQRLLPWGRLREPLSAISRADLVVLSHDLGGDNHAAEWRSRLDGPVLESRREVGGVRPYPGTVVPVALLGRNVVALSGIAAPHRFHAAIAAAGARVVETLAFPDHRRFREDDLDLAGMLVKRHDDALVVMTAKDAARLDGRRLPFPAAILESRVACDDLLAHVDDFLQTAS